MVKNNKMSDIKNITGLNWIQALRFLFQKNLFVEQNFQDAKAMIAQEKKKSCDDIFSEEIIKKILTDNGYGMDLAIKKDPIKVWVYDSITF